MATINSSPTKVEPGGSSSSAAAAAGSSANPTVMAVVKHEDADEEIDVDDSKLEVASRLGLLSQAVAAASSPAASPRLPHLSGGTCTANSGRSSSANSALSTASPHSTPPPDVKPVTTSISAATTTAASTVPLMLANQSMSRTQNLSPGLNNIPPSVVVSGGDNKSNSVDTSHPEDKRTNNNTSSYISGGRLKVYKGKGKDSMPVYGTVISTLCRFSKLKLS